MGAGASTALNESKRKEIKNAKTDEEKLKLFEEFQKRIIEDELKHQHAGKIQKVVRGKNARKVAKSGDDLQIVFAKFANFGKSKNQKGPGDSIDSTRFRKMMKDSKLIHKKKFKNVDCDMCHTKCKTKGEKLMTFTEFLEKALPIIAEKHGVEEGEIAFMITNSGPSKSGTTKADYSKFYDDKSTWTGVATRGGPSTDDKVLTLSKMMDRSDADVRGIGSNSGR